MNDYETLGRFPYTSIRQYGFSSGDRNAPAFLSHAARPDFRGCPLTSRNRSTSGRDLEEQGGGPPRRRIAVAVSKTYLSGANTSVTVKEPQVLT
jgi:hypothetical protein